MQWKPLLRFVAVAILAATGGRTLAPHLNTLELGLLALVIEVALIAALRGPICRRKNR